MKRKISMIVEDRKLAPLIDHIFRTGLLNSDRKYLEELYPGISDDTISVNYMFDEGIDKLYAARDTVTKKLVSDITNPRRKYWDKKGNATNAIDHYNRSCAGVDKQNRRGNRNKGEHNILELVEFKLIETEKEDA